MFFSGKLKTNSQVDKSTFQFAVASLLKPLLQLSASKIICEHRANLRLRLRLFPSLREPPLSLKNALA